LESGPGEICAFAKLTDKKEARKRRKKLRSHVDPSPMLKSPLTSGSQKTKMFSVLAI